MTRHLSKKFRSKQSEKALAKQLGGKVQPASGSLPVKSLKGDVKTAHWLIDDKVTGLKSYGLKADDFRKIRKQAFGLHKRPAMRVHFDNGPILYVIQEQDFLEMQDKL